MAKKGELSLFETQKKTKPTPEELCDRFLTDDELHDGMTRLLALCKNLRMSPGWYATNSFKCVCKGKPVLSFRIGEGRRAVENRLEIMVYTAEREKINEFLSRLPEDAKIDCIKSLKHCIRCAGCAPGWNVDILGTVHNLCFKGHNLVFLNPTAEQFAISEKFILFRREYIKTL